MSWKFCLFSRIINLIVVLKIKTFKLHCSNYSHHTNSLPCTFTPGPLWCDGTVIGQAAVQQEEQQNSRQFGCRFHHDPEPQNQVQQSPRSSLLFCLRLSLSVFVCVYVCVGRGALTAGSKYEPDWWVGHVWWESSACLLWLSLQDHSGRLIQTCSKCAEHLQENNDFIYCDSRFTMETKYAKIMNGIKFKLKYCWKQWILQWIDSEWNYSDFFFWSLLMMDNMTSQLTW